jgi:hypothetical protein
VDLGHGIIEKELESLCESTEFSDMDFNRYPLKQVQFCGRTFEKIYDRIYICTCR